MNSTIDAPFRSWSLLRGCSVQTNFSISPIGPSCWNRRNCSRKRASALNIVCSARFEPHHSQQRQEFEQEWCSGSIAVEPEMPNSVRMQIEKRVLRNGEGEVHSIVSLHHFGLPKAP